MTIEEALYSYLTSHPGVSALVGTRVYPLKLPQNPKLPGPTITYHKVSLFAQRTIGSSGPQFYEERFQFSCWAETYDEAKILAWTLISALQDYSGEIGTVKILDAHTVNETDIYEETVGIYHIPVDIVIHRI